MFIIFFLLALSSVFFIGYLCYTAFFHCPEDRAEETITLSFALGIPILSLIHFFVFWSGADFKIYNLGVYLLLICLFLSVCFFRKRPFPSPFRLSLGLFILFAVIILLYT
ncbi:MAG: hypothetical protein KC713_00955, partial [Candidatus Omnitrophica bacterium]|nr:hypothetical protein [Candidatus Omnitrophota bacterium]